MLVREWPFDNNINETSISINQRMVGKLILRRDTPSLFVAIGQEVNYNRKRLGLTLRQASTLMGLDSGFLCVLEQGHATGAEIDQVGELLVSNGFLKLLDLG